jgi:hypothetical protein
MPLTVVYDNGVYKAFSTERVYIFADDALQGVYDVADIERVNNLIDREYSAEVERHIKAYIQQYYEHAERKSYIVPDSLSSGNAR